MIARHLGREFNAFIETVATAEAAIDCIDASPALYDVVISDWNLAGQLKGDAVLRALERQDCARKLVFFTSEEDLARAIHSAIAVKPCSVFALDDLVRAVLKPVSHTTFATALLSLWHEAHKIGLPVEDFERWSGATKDLLIALGLEWDSERDDYKIRQPSATVTVEP
jgi:hypothetical protein